MVDSSNLKSEINKKLSIIVASIGQIRIMLRIKGFKRQQEEKRQLSGNFLQTIMESLKDN